MENLIPLPTDNIFKFYALFGLLLIIFGMGALLYTNESKNRFVFEVGVEYVTLAAMDERSVPDEARFDLLERKLEITRSDHNFYLYSLSGVMAMGILLMWHGFRKWHKEIQPIQDEIARLNLKKLKREMGEEEST